MNSTLLKCGSFPVEVNISRFSGASGVDEYHLSLLPTESGPMDAQLRWIEGAYRAALDSLGLGAKTAVLRRFFCSDLANQQAALEARSFSTPRRADEPCAVSWVCQPPGPTARVALWAYHVHDPRVELDKEQDGDSLTLRRNGLVHCWTTGIASVKTETSYNQTRDILEEYNCSLRRRGMTLASNAMRTWFFVQEIDADYQGLVKGRREFFAAQGLTADTHYIASTGVGGGHADGAARVAMDAYAISGIRPEQIRFLTAPSHLSSANIYGVTFERGTAIAYADRNHAIISGTASIDRDGKIVHPRQALSQLNRTIENISALLEPLGATLKDMAQIIVYIRDPSDHPTVVRAVRERFGQVPAVAVWSKVCRPGWLVEIEGMAIIPAANRAFPAF